MGPVQEFIEASRRSRDLHWSSNFVEKTALAAAAALKRAVHGVDFIAPPLNDHFREDGSVNPVPTSDRVLAILPDGVDPRDASGKAGVGAYAPWNDAIDDVQDKLNNGPDLGFHDNVWNEQKVEQRVEFYSAWVPLDENDFRAGRSQVERLLDAREEFSDFVPSLQAHRVSKSSLDGRRESVLQRLLEADNRRNHRAELGIKPGEMLDLPGLVKRLAGDEHFPPGSRIAVDPFIRGVMRRDDGDRQKQAVLGVRQKLEDLKGQNRSGFFSYTNETRYGDFCFDGHQLFADRLDSLKGDYPSYVEDLKDLKDIVTGAKISPCPYLAVIACDGDGMGKMIRDAKTPQENREISQRMQTFANSVNEIVETAANGSAIFAGGDDVLAFVPLDRMLDCVEALQQSFRTNVTGCTISVGVAIVHMLTPMAGEMIKNAHDAEKDAKSGRWEFANANLIPEDKRLAEADGKRGNAVAFHLYKRSGAPIKLRMAWPDATHGDAYHEHTSPVTRMKGWVHLLREDLIPDRLAYEMRTLARHYGNASQTGPITDQNGETWVTAELLHVELKRLLGKKQKGEQDQLTKRVREMILDRIPEPPTEANDTVKEAFAHQAWLSLRQMAEEIIVARALLPAYLDSGEAVDVPNAPAAQQGGAL
ncbi:MAG: type III-B CRISPR-associated protein Cas10/Cmr2 [Deltaproteobacteria bacterium]|nr:type III-B CRISPR-associated protein Cas10/Cmr2 [Deltaproteobacteria bacterium]